LGATAGRDGVKDQENKGFENIVRKIFVFFQLVRNSKAVMRVLDFDNNFRCDLSLLIIPDAFSLGE
jgi:hypothetical protein